MLARAEANPATLTLILAEQVNKELDEHLDEVQTGGERAIRQLDDRIDKVLGVFKSFGCISATAKSSLSQRGYPVAARGIVDRFIAAADVVRTEPGVFDRAWNRVKSGTALAARGKQEMKDRVVVETYLDVTKEPFDTNA